MQLAGRTCIINMRNTTCEGIYTNFSKQTYGVLYVNSLFNYKFNYNFNNKPLAYISSFGLRNTNDILEE